MSCMLGARVFNVQIIKACASTIVATVLHWFRTIALCRK